MKYEDPDIDYLVKREMVAHRMEGLRSLAKRTGARETKMDRSTQLLAKNKIRQLREWYQKHSDDEEKIPWRYDPVYFVGTRESTVRYSRRTKDIKGEGHREDPVYETLDSIPRIGIQWDEYHQAKEDIRNRTMPRKAYLTWAKRLLREHLRRANELIIDEETQLY